MGIPKAAAPTPSDTHRLNSLSTALRVLSEVEALPPGATGALLHPHGTGAEGAVLVEKGRICAVLATPLRSRLAARLAEVCEPRSSGEDFQRQLRLGFEVGEARSGEIYLPDGVLRRSKLEQELWQHALDALVDAPDCWEGPAQWLPHRCGSYAAEATYSPVELLLGASERLRSAAARAGPFMLELGHTLQGLTDGAAFDVGTGALLALHGFGGDTPPLERLGDIGSWAARSLSDGRGENVVRVAPKTSTLGVLVAWRRRSVANVAFCNRRQAFLGVVASLREQGLFRVAPCQLPPPPDRPLPSFESVR